MKALRLIVATFLATAILAVGGQVATADNNKAQAYTLRFYNQIVCTYSASGVGYAWIDRRMVTDYSWGEEFWLGYRDSDVFIRRDRAAQYDYMCRTWRA